VGPLESRGAEPGDGASTSTPCTAPRERLAATLEILLAGAPDAAIENVA